MKAAHAAALAVVGWYLMMPPGDIHTCPETSAPISEWEVSQSYDTAAQCESDLGKLRREMLHELAKHKLNGPCGVGKMDPMAAKFVSAECIATDDPRLKEK